MSGRLAGDRECEEGKYKFSLILKWDARGQGEEREEIAEDHCVYEFLIGMSEEF